MDEPVVELAFVGLAASYRRGVARVAVDSGVSREGGTTVTLVRLDRLPESCARIDQLVAAGTGPVVALVEPLDSASLAHALSHGAFVADHEAEPERVVAAAVAAAEGAILVPRDLMAAFASTPIRHDAAAISEEEAAWLVALAAGATVVKVADDFGYSERALFRRLADLYTRLGASSRSEAIVAAERLGILRLE
jgi:DNA-binding NarL/FixJ family response regulator